VVEIVGFVVEVGKREGTAGPGYGGCCMGVL
jgi:hypothetical protein